MYIGFSPTAAVLQGLKLLIVNGETGTARGSDPNADRQAF
jgi:hypothetical protein